MGKNECERIALKGAEAFKKKNYAIAKKLFKKAKSLSLNDEEYANFLAEQIVRINKILGTMSEKSLKYNEKILNEVNELDNFLYFLKDDSILSVFSLSSLKKECSEGKKALRKAVAERLISSKRLKSLENEMEEVLKRKPLVSDRSLINKIKPPNLKTIEWLKLTQHGDLNTNLPERQKTKSPSKMNAFTNKKR